MQINELTSVVRRTEVDALEMALLTTERVVDLGVAHQAVGHTRKMRGCRESGFFDAAVARLASIVCIEMPASVAGAAQVTAVIDRGGNQRRDVPELEMELMVETVGTRLGCDCAESGGVNGCGGAALMTYGTFFLRRQQAVRRCLAVFGRTMAVHARGARLLEMELMREVQFLRGGMPANGAKQCQEQKATKDRRL